MLNINYEIEGYGYVIEQDIKQKERETKIYDQIKNLCSVWKDMEFKEKRNIVEQLLDKIVVDGKTLKIYWNVSES